MKLSPSSLACALLLFPAACPRAAGSPQDASTPYKRQSVQAVLAYLLNPGTEALKNALAASLASREKISGDALNDFLIAFCRREAGDAAGETRVLLPYSPQARDTYRFLFDDHRDALADGLFALASPCGLREVGAQQGRTDDCFDIDDVKAPEGIRVKKGRAIRSILDQVGHGLLDNRLQLEPGFDEAGPEALLARIGVKEGASFADIGCGVGYMVFPASKLVGPSGRVYAEDIDPAQIELIRYVARAEKRANIAPVLGTPSDMGFPPGAIDVALLLNVYKVILRDVSRLPPAEREAFWDGFFGNIRKALKSDGTLVIAGRINPRYGFTVKQTSAALEKRGLRLVADKSPLPGRTAILFFRKSGSN